MDPSDVPKHEEGGSDKAQSGPEKIQGDFFSHVEQGESRKDHHGDDFLQDFQLREGEPLIADAVGGTWRQYSRNATDQLTRMAINSGL